jgi:hypothetical protein
MGSELIVKKITVKKNLFLKFILTVIFLTKKSKKKGGDFFGKDENDQRTVRRRGQRDSSGDGGSLRAFDGGGPEWLALGN